MIKAKKGRCILRGKASELLADYFIISRQLREVLPKDAVEHSLELAKLTRDEFKERMAKNNG